MCKRLTKKYTNKMGSHSGTTELNGSHSGTTELARRPSRGRKSTQETSQRGSEPETLRREKRRGVQRPITEGEEPYPTKKTTLLPRSERTFWSGFHTGVSGAKALSGNLFNYMSKENNKRKNIYNERIVNSLCNVLLNTLNKDSLFTIILKKPQSSNPPGV